MKRSWIMALILASCASSAPVEESPPKSTQALEALESCLDALGEDHPKPMQRAEAATGTCGQIWSEPDCSRAWTQSLDLYAGERAPAIMSACAAAYCPTMAEPRAELCKLDASEADLIDEQVDWLEIWTSFNRRALADTLGEENAIEAAQFSRTLMLMVSMTSGRRHGS